MNLDSNHGFQEGDWLIDRHNPAQPGQFTGKIYKAGPYDMVEIRFPGGHTKRRPLRFLVKMKQTEHSLIDRMLAGEFGTVYDLRRVITYEKLKGTLHEVIYSMEAAQIDFYPYQFKPVMKLISAPTERLIIADEVGLGKTIESALIWLELQARRQAKRLLVVCPTSLAEKWRKELREKFLINAEIVNFRKLHDAVKEFHEAGPGHSFALIGTYAGLRPPKEELNLLRQPPDDARTGTPKTEFLRTLKHTQWENEPFDLVIFDEAHYMRNSGTSTFALGEALADSAIAVLCVSATPVNNSNLDLHSLLRLVDPSFFENQSMFDELLKANRPTVQAGNALARTPLNHELLTRAIEQMRKSHFIQDSPLFKRFVEGIRTLNPKNKHELARCQDIVEKLNILGQYVNRTRRVQVKEHRPFRDPVVLPVKYNNKEMQLYRAILLFVRDRCRRTNKPFHIFQILQLQLRAASCLPVVASELREEKSSASYHVLEEAFGEAEGINFFDANAEEEVLLLDRQELLEHDFEAKDTKYEALREMLVEKMPEEKVIIFAFYRGTLSYLHRRLPADGITATMIHGGINPEERDKELERFEDPRGPRVLLSSEVGSEGIDLQFCRVVVNYDLPWNPMRVEQRIGRIDRVGQRAERLNIVNFKVRDTVEERLYERLHEKIFKFANSLGDLEAIIGQEVLTLTVDILSQELTPEQESIRMDRTETAIETQLLQLQQLEESGDSLLALSDYLQRRIDEVRDRGRYMVPDELEDYVADFFDREFNDCEVNENTPAYGCLRVRLGEGAHKSLTAFIKDDASLSARPFRDKEFSFTFRRDVFQKLDAGLRRRVHFTNHLSPLIRWITKINREHSHALFNVSALSLEANGFPDGVYCYRIDRWNMRALTTREGLAYSVIRLGHRDPLSPDDSEQMIQTLLREGKRWPDVQFEREELIHSYRTLEEALTSQFDAAVTDFIAENETAVQIKEQRVRNFFDRRIEQDERRLRTLAEQERGEKVLRLTRGRLENARQRKEEKLAEIQTRAEPDLDASPVAAGLFLVQ